MKVGIDATTLGAWIPIPEPCKRILDIGTGTGILALMAAQRVVDAEVIAVEIDEDAAQQARENFAESAYADRLTSHQVSIQDYVKSKPGTFDLIISNPPFFTGGVLSEQLEKQTARHTVRLSHTDLLHAVQQLLRPGGLFCVVLPKIEGLRFIEIAASMKFKPHQILKMRPREGKPTHRLFIAFGTTAPDQLIEKELIQYGEGNKYSEEYAALVNEYYPEGSH